MSTRFKSAALLLLLVYFISEACGSAIQFTSSASAIKPLLSRNMTLRCSIHDTSTSGSIVGRSLTSLSGDGNLDDDVTVSQDDQTGTDPKDTNNDSHTKSKKSVTNTTQDIMLVTSIVISRDGADLATLIDHFGAKAVGGASGFHVTGQLSTTASEKGFLELVWPHPTQADTGLFRCDIDTVSPQGHSFDFSDTVAVSEEEMSISDIVSHLHSVEIEKENMQATIGAMKHTEDAMKQTIEDMKLADDLMKKQIQNLQSENAALKNSTVPNIFFTAGLTHSFKMGSNSVLVYDYVFVNEGNAYDNSTGAFTCPISGFYHFEINGGSQSGESIWLILKLNGRKIIESYTTDAGLSGSSNSAIVKLVKGDKLQVHDFLYGSQVYGGGTNYILNTITGRLIAFD